jgi:hypothetical protein
MQGIPESEPLMRLMTPKLAFTVVMAILVGSGAAMAAETPAVVNQTHASVQKFSTNILKLAYPTAKTLLENPAGTWNETRTGYILDEKFIYTDSDGDRQSFTLRFYLNERGIVSSVSEAERSELWPTFGTGNLLLEVLKEAARNDIKTARANGKEPPQIAVAILRVTDIKEVAVLWVNVGR